MRRSGFLSLVLAACLGAAPASAATLTVDNDKRECRTAGFRSIQAAVTAAAPGDQINVCAGSYREQVFVPRDKADITLVSTPRRKAVIAAPKSFQGLPRAVVVAAGDRGVVRGFQIIGPLPARPGGCDFSFTHEAGVQTGGTDVRVEDNRIDGIRDNCGFGAGVFVGDAQNELGLELSGRSAHIVGNTISNYARQGVLVESTGVGSDGAAEILGNEIVGAPTRPNTGILQGQEGSIFAVDNLIRVNRDYGVTLAGSDSGFSTVRDNRVNGNRGGGILLADSGSDLIEDNRLYRNSGDGITVRQQFGSSTLVGNVAIENSQNGFNLGDISQAEVTGNQAIDNGRDGFFVSGAFNELSDNLASGNDDFDCRDVSGPGGPGTLGTYNTWTGNTGATSSPAGLCQP